MVLINVALALLNCLLALPSCFDPAEPCLNGGVCVKQVTNKAHSTLCSCSAGYSGEKCEKVLNVCEAFPHYCNAGTCVSINGSAICHCPMGYFGHNCEYTFDKCKVGNMCRNGGTCIDGICFCTDGFSGEVCERHVPERDDYLRAGCEEHPEFCALRFADGTCNEECNNEKCFFDGFDCVVSTQECRLSDYCALHYLDGKCDEKCAVAECGYDGMDCDRNMLLRDLTDSSTIGIKLHNPVRLALDSNNKTRIYEWSFENGVGKEINLREWEMSRNATSVLLYVDIDSTFCEQRLHLNTTKGLPCFTDIFGAVAYLHTALYDEAKNRISLGDVTVEGLFVESDRSRSLPIFAIFITCFVFIGMILSCFYGIYGFFGVLKRQNIGKNHAPVWKVPSSLQSNATSWSTVSSVEDYLLNEDICRRDGLPPLSRLFSNSTSCRREQPKDFKNHYRTAKNNEQKILISLDAYFSDNGNENCHLGPDLLKAVKCNDIEAVSFLVLHGADVNCFDSDKNTALHHAVVVNSDQIIRLLLSTHRCNLRAVNVLGQTPLTLTVKFAHVSDLCARCILDFMYTEYYRQTKVRNDTFTPQLIPSQNGVSRLMTSNNYRQFDSSLKQTERDGCIFTRDILSEKDDPTLTDIFGRTALHYAALNRRVNLLPILYSFGLKLDTEDTKGETPLYLAAREGYLDMVNLLLSFGANSEISDQLGRTPLDVARERGHCFIVEFLENAAVNNIDIMKTQKRKRSRKPSSAAKCKSKLGSYIPVASSQENISLTSSSIAVGLNDDYTEDVGDIDEDMTISSSFLNSVESFVLTPTGQIIAEAEKELDLDVVDPAVPDYIDLSTNSCLPTEFFSNNAFSVEPFQVRRSSE
ncbi:Ankyrin repeats (3 copies) family protein [Brugia pahangi]